MSDIVADYLELETELRSDGEWVDELNWSPSQCYYHLTHRDVDYILYLRWRWKDPWQGYVIRNVSSVDDVNEDPAVWSGDVFEMNHTHYSAGELELAKEKIISLFYKFDGQFTELRTILEQMA